MNRRLIEVVVILASLLFGYLLISGIQKSSNSSLVNDKQVSALPTFPAQQIAPTSSESPIGKVIGLLTIPAAEVLTLPIARGVDEVTLNTGVAGAYSWSGPGENGVFALAAHRVGAGGPFRHLDRVEIGDRIVVESGSKKFNYRIISNITVDPTDTSVLNGPKDDSRIVLITCTPLDTFAKRIVVTGQLIRD